MIKIPLRDGDLVLTVTNLHQTVEHSRDPASRPVRLDVGQGEVAVIVVDIVGVVTLWSPDASGEGA